MITTRKKNLKKDQNQSQQKQEQEKITAQGQSQKFFNEHFLQTLQTKDFQNRTFVIENSFLLQNLIPLMTDRKFDNESDRRYVKILW